MNVRAARSGGALGGQADQAVRRLILGGRFGEEPQSVSWQRLDRFAEAGGQLVETAHSYAAGRAEETIGGWLAANPGALAVVDKIGHPDDKGHHDMGQNNLLREAETSSRRLGGNHVDVLLLHRDDPLRPVGELAETLLELLSQGFAARVGVSNWAPGRLSELADFMEHEGQQLAASYHRSLATPAMPLWPGTLHATGEVVELLRQRGIPLLAWAAHARGYFTGATDVPRPGEPDPFDTEANAQRRLRCSRLATERGLKPEAVALAWLLHQPQTYSIVGPLSVTELDISLEAAEISLSADDLDWLVDGDG